jgi:RHS repeat-associated protein
MKQNNYYLVFFLLIFFGQIQAGIYPNYTQNIAVPNLNNNGQSGTGGGTITINNDVLTIDITATWASLSYLKLGVVASLTISPALPNMELGQLSSAGNPWTNFAAKIENNTLVFYLTNSPTQLYGCTFSFSKNLACDSASTWYLDDDVDGLGDPSKFIVQQCTKPNGNYVLDNTDNCPTISGTNTNCSSLEPILQNQNFIKSINYKTPTSDSIINPTIVQANQNTTYFDGLGRPIQQIASQQSGIGNDIITNIEYDNFGRQIKDYLPYASTQSTSAFIDPATLVTNIISKYQTNYGSINGNPYSQKELEASPLNRVLKQAAPGNDWKLGNGHEIKFDYQTNTGTEVKLYKATATWNLALGLYDISLLDIGNYDINQLYKTITYDENTVAPLMETASSTVEFKNKEGQVVLKRSYGTVGSGTVNEKYDTYYIYDDYGNLTYVLPPKAVDIINPTNLPSSLISAVVLPSGSPSLSLVATNSIILSNGFHAQAGSAFKASIDNSSQNILDNLCYQYKYDLRNRLVEKKLPGKQWEFIVYDKLDRVVATGPAFSPFSDTPKGVVGWMITKYDVFNRPVYTGWEQSTTVTSAGRLAKQTTMNGLTTFSESKQTTANTIDNLTGIAYYSNAVMPTAFKLLTVNYYDDYVFQTFTPAIAYTVPVAYNNTTLKPKGMSTGSWTRVLTTLASPTGESSYILYDAKARPVRTFSANYLGGYTQIDNTLNAFSGQLLSAETRHKRVIGDAELYVKDTYTYTAQDRLFTHTHKIGTGGTEQLLTKNEYDELGQLIVKRVGGTDLTGTSPLQKVDFAYNIRGWMTEINKTASLAQGTDPKDLFAFKINYNTVNTGITDVKALYNGNIAETYWNTADVQRAYGYKYDNLNRLTTAVFQKAAVTTNAYNETLSYDKNGNIMSLVRNGGNETADQIDNLIYNYGPTNNMNQLTKVVDGSNKTTGFIDSANNSLDDYAYDANGNMTIDNNKNITSIIYNHLNQPTRINFYIPSNGYNLQIEYIYNSLGEKLQKIVYGKTAGQTDIRTTDYLDGFQYESFISPVQGSSASTLLFFTHAEGYVEPIGSSFKYVYQYKDHLGNVRLSYDKNLQIQEENNYYPFGLRQEGYNIVKNSTNAGLKYKFNGKELQDELGLNMYDYGARNYDPALGRWMNIDPLAEKMRRWSPYNYCFDNPMKFVDPDGMAPSDHIFDSKGNFIRDTGVGNAVKVEIGNKSYNLSDLDYSKKGTRLAVSNIIGHYASKMGASGYFGVDASSSQDKNVGGYTRNNGTVMMNAKSFQSGFYNNFHDLSNTIAHEGSPVFGHKSENISSDKYTFLDHSKVYLGQTQTGDFNNTSDNNKYSVSSGFTNRVYNAMLNGEIDLDGVKSQISNFNTLNANNGVNIQSKFDGNGVNVQVNKSTFQIQLETLSNPHN